MKEYLFNSKCLYVYGMLSDISKSDVVSNAIVKISTKVVMSRIFQYFNETFWYVCA